MSIWTWRGSATSHAIDRIARELAVDGDVISNTITDHDAHGTADTASEMRALLTRADACMTQLRASLGMFETLALVPDDVPLYKGRTTVDEGPLREEGPSDG